MLFLILSSSFVSTAFGLDSLPVAGIVSTVPTGRARSIFFPMQKSQRSPS